MAIVEIINLTKSFKDIEVIHNTSFYFNATIHVLTTENNQKIYSNNRLYNFVS